MPPWMMGWRMPNSSVMRVRMKGPSGVGGGGQRALRVGTIVPGPAAPLGPSAPAIPDAARCKLCVDSRLFVSVWAKPWNRRIEPNPRATILTPEMIEPSMNIDGVGGDCPGQAGWHPDVLRGARVYVEFEPQTHIDGDIRPLGADFSVVDLWGVLAHTAPGRQNDTPVTMFDSVGFALEDYSALRFVDRLAREHAIGQDVDLVPPVEDPKDLFRFAQGAPRRADLRRVA